MPPFLALGLWFLMLVGLLRYDSARIAGITLALWIPVTGLFFLGSRLPSQWLGTSFASGNDAYMEGNALDRVVFFGLALLAITILGSRSFRWQRFIANNVWLVAFLAFALLSVAWSDYTFIALKRWIRDVSGYLTLMVVLTERNTADAVRTVIRRVSYLLIPLSIVFVKYYPELGRAYGPWSGAIEYQGVTTSKNMLGVLCLVSALFFSWELRTRLKNWHQPQEKRVILIDAAFLAMTVWLLSIAQSATSMLCVVLGTAFIILSQSAWSRRHRTAVTLAAPAVIVLYVALELGMGISAVIAEVVGRDPTLTDRTDIWKLVLELNTSPILGAGYETFWLGPRLTAAWARYKGLNHAHNGYLELYLNLGVFGLSMLMMYVFVNYGRICRILREGSQLASLGVSTWTVLMFYNITEAAFKPHLLWSVFLMMTFATNAEVASNVPVADFNAPPSRPIPLRGQGGHFKGAVLPSEHVRADRDVSARRVRFTRGTGYRAR